MGVSQTLISRWYVVRERVVMDGSRRLVPVGWIDALQVLKEKVAATAITVASTVSMATTGYHDQFKILLRLDERIGEAVG